MSDNIIEIKGLTVEFETAAGALKAVNDVTLGLARGEAIALVGESGCGKSMTALAIMRLVPPPGVIKAGQIWMNGQDLLTLSQEKMRRLRGREIAMIFQDPMTSLNPVFTVGDQIAEAIQLHQGLNRNRARARAVDMMERVRIPGASRRARDYPHQLSGGMRQRVMIAMALSCNPKLLIADEPTTALDVTIQAEILDLLRNLREEMDLSILLITHDLGVVAENAGSVAVMYAGRIVEQAPVRELFRNPRHPYTIGLLRSVPRPSRDGARRGRLETIEGTVPNLAQLPRGCVFAPRCRYAILDCTKGEIPLLQVSTGHQSRCIRFDELPPASNAHV
jgi:oligopeptide/dipeptide ABC transporter ATP-binding protein